MVVTTHKRYNSVTCFKEIKVLKDFINTELQNVAEELIEIQERVAATLIAEEGTLVLQEKLLKLNALQMQRALLQIMHQEYTQILPESEEQKIKDLYDKYTLQCMNLHLIANAPSYLLVKILSDLKASKIEAEEIKSSIKVQTALDIVRKIITNAENELAILHADIMQKIGVDDLTNRQDLYSRKNELQRYADIEFTYASGTFSIKPFANRHKKFINSPHVNPLPPVLCKQLMEIFFDSSEMELSEEEQSLLLDMYAKVTNDENSEAPVSLIEGAKVAITTKYTNARSKLKAMFTG